jgi:hypothetical protein
MTTEEQLVTQVTIIAERDRFSIQGHRRGEPRTLDYRIE